MRLCKMAQRKGRRPESPATTSKGWAVEKTQRKKIRRKDKRGKRKNQEKGTIQYKNLVRINACICN